METHLILDETRRLWVVESRWAQRTTELGIYVDIPIARYPSLETVMSAIGFFNLMQSSPQTQAYKHVWGVVFQTAPTEVGRLALKMGVAFPLAEVPG